MRPILYYQSDNTTLGAHIRWADGVVVLYSITDRGSYERARQLHRLIHTVHKSDDFIPIVLGATKTDLSHARRYITVHLLKLEIHVRI